MQNYNVTQVKSSKKSKNRINTFLNIIKYFYLSAMLLFLKKALLTLQIWHLYLQKLSMGKFRVIR